MRLDWRLVHEILQALEDKPAGQEFVRMDAFPEWDRAEVAGHMKLLERGGLIDAAVHDGPGVLACAARDLTLEGHNLLGKLRNKPIWNSVASTARQHGLDLTLDVVKALSAKAFERLVR